MQEHPLGPAASRRRRHADQNLRAAAPDLLRCLRNLRNLYVELHGHETAYSREADAAIAKAEGRSAVATGRPGDMAAAYAEETGIDYSTALVHCNMD